MTNKDEHTESDGSASAKEIYYRYRHLRLLLENEKKMKTVMKYIFSKAIKVRKRNSSLI